MKPLVIKHRRNIWKIAFILVILGSLVSFAIYNQSHQSTSILSGITKRPLTFSLFWPSTQSQITPYKQSIKYDPTNKLITYNAKTASGAHLIITEQETPTSFNDIPQVYTQLLLSMSQYSSFDSQSGTVYLTHPKELNGGQAAVMNSKGTLIFIKPDKPMTDDNWHVLFNNLKIVN